MLTDSYNPFFYLKRRWTTGASPIYTIIIVIVTHLLLSFDMSVAQAKYHGLDDYLKAALKQNPLLVSSRLEESAATYANDAIRKSYYPQIGINSQLIVAPSWGYDPAVTNGGQFGAQLSTSYILYNGGLKSLEMEKGNLGVQQGTAGLKKLQGDVLYNIAVAYTFAVKEKRELAVLDENVELLKDYFTLVTQLHAGGQASENDVLKTSVRLNNAVIEASAKEASYRNALLDLSTGAGIPQVEVTGVDTSITSSDIDTSFHASKNIDLASAELEKQNADFDAEISQTQSMPAISLSADAGALTSIPNLQRGLGNVFGASFGVSFTLPLIPYGYFDSQFKAAQLKAESVSEQTTFLRMSLESEFAQARNDYVQAKQQLNSLIANLSTAHQDLFLSKAKYAGGSGSSIEVLDAIQSINDTKLSIEETRNVISVSEFKMRRLNYNGVDPNEW
ncbi:MAG: TolC family protein [Candidatus Kryptoniota bacterium]